MMPSIFVNARESVYVISSPFYRTYSNNADPDQTPQNAASAQGIHCLYTERSI